MSIEFIIAGWIFALAVSLHNLEEARYLPAWSHGGSRWQRPVGVREFRFAVIVLTLWLYALNVWTDRSEAGSLPVYLLAGYAFAMLLNVLVPHVVMTVLLRRYMPGLATGLLCILPAAVGLIHVGLRSGTLSLDRLIWVGPLTALGLLLSLPILLELGRRIFPTPVVELS